MGYVYARKKFKRSLSLKSFAWPRTEFNSSKLGLTSSQSFVPTCVWCLCAPALPWQVSQGLAEQEVTAGTSSGHTSQAPQHLLCAQGSFLTNSLFRPSSHN